MDVTITAPIAKEGGELELKDFRPISIITLSKKFYPKLFLLGLKKSLVVWCHTHKVLLWEDATSC